MPEEAVARSVTFYSKHPSSSMKEIECEMIKFDDFSFHPIECNEMECTKYFLYGFCK